MPIARSSAASILNVLPSLIRRVNTFDHVVQSLVRTLQPQIKGLWRVSIRRFLAGEGVLELVAVWSASETQVVPGTRISAGASSMPEVLRLDRPVFSEDHSTERTLLSQVLATEGIASWVSIPLRRDERVAGLLSLSSIEPDGLAPADVAFFENLGKVVERRFKELGG